MAAITSNTESWNGHTFSEVEGHLKDRLEGIQENVDMLMLDRLDATTVIMTSESNSVAMAICYAQGWASSSTQMTYGEAQAVTNIGTVFRGNTNLTHFDELQYFGITEIKEYAFSGCTALTKIGIPPSVVGIGKYAFVGCKTNEVYIRDLGKYCSMRATTLASLGWEETPATQTYAKLFLNNVHVVDLNIPAGVYRVSRFALRNLQFRNVTIPQGCYYFPYRAFGGCVITGNVFINMPIKEWCENLSADTYGDSLPSLNVQGDIYYITNNDETAEILQGAFTVPYTINKIKYGAFLNTKVTTVNVTSSTNIINGFTLCKNLTQISIPNTATSFLIQSCPLITNLEIPASCSIDSGNFANCTSLATIKFLGNRTDSVGTNLRVIPSSVTKIYCYATTAFSLYEVNSDISPTGTLYVPANSTGYDTGLWKTRFLDKGWTLSKTL